MCQRQHWTLSRSTPPCTGEAIHLTTAVNNHPAQIYMHSTERRGIPRWGCSCCRGHREVGRAVRWRALRPSLLGSDLPPCHCRHLSPGLLPMEVTSNLSLHAVYELRCWMHPAARSADHLPNSTVVVAKLPLPSAVSNSTCESSARPHRVLKITARFTRSL
jgi:hypothetical protein